MATASPSIGVIAAQIQAISRKSPNAKVFGIFSPRRWTGPAMHGADDERIAIYQCDSPLQMRLAIQAPLPASKIVLITQLDQAKISDDILMRLALRKLHPINSWEIVRSLFNARQLDSRITQHTFLADMLLEHASSQEFQPVAGGMLDADTVWDILLTERLQLSGARPDVVELLRCTVENNLADQWKACPTDFRRAATAWITAVAGETAGAILASIEAEHGSRTLAIGLVMGVVYHESVGRQLDKAAGRLEAYVGGTHLSTEIARRWSDAASNTISQLSDLASRRCLNEAEAILQHVGAGSHAWRSNDIESGFEQRLSHFGKELIAHVESQATVVSGELRSIYHSLSQHRLGRENSRRMERAEMAIRLAGWLAHQNHHTGPMPTGLLAIARNYVSSSGFVDWARRVLRGGESNRDVAMAFAQLTDRITELREAENRRFGEALTKVNATGRTSEGLIPVEQILDEVVAKVAAKASVLLLVIDGMSWGVFRELITDIKRRDWIELGVGQSPDRLIGLSLLPSVTEICRASLLSGFVKRGQAFDEIRGFAVHPALSALSHPDYAPTLFHKAALEGDEDSSLAHEIRRCIANEKQRVVGIVINAVDDHLDKGDQVDVVWTIQHVRALEPILAEAKAAGRRVILVSDHGHILDRQTQAHEATDGLRWRRPDGNVDQFEVEIASSRVVLPAGGRVIVPWSELVRYGPKKNGYHGGATPQEMLVPISILSSELTPPETAQELLVEYPSWWTEPTAPQTAAGLPEVERRPAKVKAPSPTLFDQPKAPTASQTPADPWIAALLRSEVFSIQKKLVGRAPIDDAKLYKLLETLARRGGFMTAIALAGAIGVPEHRLSGLLAVMQRVLNVDGFAILDRQDSTQTVMLNIPLLKKQFELGE